MSSTTAAQQQQTAPAQGSTAASANGQKRKRVSRACDQCFSKKDKCDGLHPLCLICQRLSRECTYVRPERKRGPTSGLRQKLETHISALETLLGFYIERLSFDAEASSLEAVGQTWQERDKARLRSVWRESDVKRCAEGFGLLERRADGQEDGDEEGDIEMTVVTERDQRLETRQRASTASGSSGSHATTAAMAGTRGGPPAAAATVDAALHNHDRHPGDRHDDTTSTLSPTHSLASSSTTTQQARLSSYPSFPPPSFSSISSSHRITIPTTIPSYTARGAPPLSSQTHPPPLAFRHRPGSTYRNTRGLVPPGTDPNDALGGFDLGFQDDEEGWYSGVLQGSAATTGEGQRADGRATSTTTAGASAAATEDDDAAR